MPVQSKVTVGFLVSGDEWETLKSQSVIAQSHSLSEHLRVSLGLVPRVADDVRRSALKAKRREFDKARRSKKEVAP